MYSKALPIFFLGLLLFWSCTQEDLIEDSINNSNTPNTPVSDMALTEDTKATDSQGNIYQVSFRQASSNNQNPIVTKWNAQGEEIWSLNHETSPVDGRAELIVIDNNDMPWVIFSVDGGSYDADYIDKKHVEVGAFDNAYMASYGSGGGPRVRLIARLNPKSGDIVKATFMTARLTNGKSNTLDIREIGFQNGRFAFNTKSAAWPPGEGSSYNRFPDITDEDRIDGSFRIYYEMNTDLEKIEEARLMN